MSQLREILTRQLAEHPIDFGMSDATAILEFLYTAYCESRESDPPETKSLFAQLGAYLEALPLDTKESFRCCNMILEETAGSYPRFRQATCLRKRYPVRRFRLFRFPFRLYPTV